VLTLSSDATEPTSNMLAGASAMSDLAKMYEQPTPLSRV
jgi:hypothetical protein